MDDNLEQRVMECYTQAPFPNNLSRATDFFVELDRTIRWIQLNLDYLSPDLRSSKPVKLLCAGCGTGEEAIALAIIFPHTQIKAIDISKSSLEIAKFNAKKAKIKNVTFQELSIIEGLPKLKQQYDFIYSAGVIHHLSNPYQGFQILRSKLKPKGKMVIMLYNSFGLLFYNLQLKMLHILAGDNFAKRMHWVKIFGLARNKNQAFVFDTYINPQVKTFSIEEIIDWGKKNYLTLIGLVPPLDFNRILEFALQGQDYFFRRKGLVSVVLNITKGLPKQKWSVFTGNTLIFQLLFLLLGKGECQYLFQDSGKEFE